MRTAIRSLAAVLGLTLVACSSGGVTVVRPAPDPVPAVVHVPAPVVYVEPLEIDLARPHQGKVFVQTSRAAYVAIFEIVPERGVELVYPASPRQRGFVAGLREVPTWWESSRVTYRAGWSTSRAYPGRYIYALASDEPLNIPDAAYRTGYLRDVLGSGVYSSANPYATMRALAREFVPEVRDEEWAEDTYVLSPSYATEPYRVTRVYCRGGTMYEVPSELADRVWCPTYGRGQSNGPGRVTEVETAGPRQPLARPDSVVGDNGRHLATRTRGGNGRGPIDRVKEPPGPENRGNGPVANNDDRPGKGPVKPRPGVGPRDIPHVVPNERTVDQPTRGRGAEVVDDHRGKSNGNGEGKQNGNGDPKPNGNGESRPNGRGEAKPNGHAEAKPNGNGEAKPNESGEPKANGNSDSKPNGIGEGKPNGNGAGKPNGDGDSKSNGNGEAKSNGNSESKSNSRHEPKSDSRGEPKSDPRGESESDSKAESKPDQKSEPTPDAKTESKPDASGSAKPQTSGETEAEPKKGRGRPDAKDEKPGNGKSKQQRDQKP